MTKEMIEKLTTHHSSECRTMTALGTASSIRHALRNVIFTVSVVLSIVFSSIVFMACGTPPQYVQKLETEMMVADLNDQTTKTITLTSSENQILKSVTFDGLPDNPFTISKIEVNSQDLTQPPVNTTDFGVIDYALQKGDKIRITLVFAPVATSENPEADLRKITKRVLKAVFDGGSQSAIVGIHLRGMSLGICSDCQLAVSGDPVQFDVKAAQMSLHDSDLDTDTDPAVSDGDTQPITDVEGTFTFYMPNKGTAAGNIFLKGADIPTFIIPVIKDGNEYTLQATGKAGDVFMGTYDEDGSFRIPAVRIVVTAGGKYNFYMTLTTQALSVPTDYAAGGIDADAYAAIEDSTFQLSALSDLDGTFSDTGLAYDETSGDVTMIGAAVIPNIAIFDPLTFGIIGLSFEMTRHEE